jgi:hypothetical protein
MKLVKKVIWESGCGSCSGDVEISTEADQTDVEMACYDGDCGICLDCGMVNTVSAEEGENPFLTAAD